MYTRMPQGMRRAFVLPVGKISLTIKYTTYENGHKKIAYPQARRHRPPSACHILPPRMKKPGALELFPADQALHFNSGRITISHLNFLKVCKFMHAAKTYA